MGNPQASDVHVNAPLTNFSEAYLLEQKDFVADKVFPMVPVKKQSDLYFIYDKGDFLRDEVAIKAAGGTSAETEFDVTTGNYYAKKYSLKKKITDEDKANADAPIKLQEDTVEFLMQKHLIKKEVLFGTNFFNTNLWTTDLTGVASGTPNSTQFLRWDVSSSDPVNDVDTAKLIVKGLTGFRPNILVVQEKVHMALRSNASILDRIKYTQKGVVTEDLLAELFGVDKYLVAGAVKNSAAKGATDSIDYIFDNDALLAYAPAVPGIKKPSAGYTFSWVGLEGIPGYKTRVRTWRNDEEEADYVESTCAFDQKLIAADLGAFFDECIS